MGGLAAGPAGRVMTVGSVARHPASAFRNPASIFSAAAEARKATDASTVAAHVGESGVLPSVAAPGRCPGPPLGGLGLATQGGAGIAVGDARANAATHATESTELTIHHPVYRFCRFCHRLARAGSSPESVWGRRDRSDETVAPVSCACCDGTTPCTGCCRSRAASGGQDRGPLRCVSCDGHSM